MNLFFPVCHWPHHFETELELMNRSIENGEDVTVVLCNGRLPACIKYDKQSFIQCLACRSRTKNGLKLLPRGKFSIMTLPVIKKCALTIPDRFDSVDAVFKYYWEDADLGKAAISSLSMRHDYEHKFENLQDYYLQLRRDILAGYYVYEGMKELFKKIKVDKVYIFNGRFASVRSLLRLCQSRKIPYATHERAGVVEKYWVVENSIPHDTKYASEEARRLWKEHSNSDYEDAENWYCNRRGGIPMGWHSYIGKQNREELPESFELYKEKIKVTIYNSTIGENWGVDGWDKVIYDDPTLGVERIVSDFIDDSRFVFFLRVHPNLGKYKTNSQMRDIKELEGKYQNLVIIPTESPVSSYALMDNSDMVLTFGSTMAVEACFWGKPAILVGKALFEEFDCCYVPDSHEEVIELLKKCPPPKSKEGALIYSSWELRRGERFRNFVPVGFGDGTFNGHKVEQSYIVRKLEGLFRRIDAVKKVFGKHQR